MDHRVTVRTERPQVLHGIDAVSLADRRERNRMMNVNTTIRDFALDRPEIRGTGEATESVVLKASAPRARVSLVSNPRDRLC